MDEYVIYSCFLITSGICFFYESSIAEILAIFCQESGAALVFFELTRGNSRDCAAKGASLFKNRYFKLGMGGKGEEQEKEEKYLGAC